MSTNEFHAISEKDIESARGILTGGAPIISSHTLRQALDCLSGHGFDTKDEPSHYPSIDDMRGSGEIFLIHN